MQHGSRACHRPTVGAALAAALAEAGVDMAYTVPGEPLLPLLEAAPFRVVPARHEGPAAMMAEAHGRLTGRPALCLVSRGPGVANAIAGLVVAERSASPMILLAGDVDTRWRGRRAFQGGDLEGLLRPVTRWLVRLEDPMEAATVARAAVARSLDGEPGPVAILVGGDVLDAPPAEAPEGGAASSVPAPSADRQRLTLEGLSRAERPTLLVGRVGWSGASAARLGELADRDRLAVVAAFRCQDVLDNRRPAYVGHATLSPAPGVVDAVTGADAIVTFGTGLDEVTTLADRLPRERTTAVYPVPLPGVGQTLAGPAEAFLDAVDEARPGPDLAARRSGWVAALRQRHEVFADPACRHDGSEAVALLAALGDALPPDAIVTHGAGAYAAVLQRHVGPRCFPSQLAPQSGTMGYGLAAAIAAAIAAPDRPVVAVAGDGDFQMVLPELATVVAEGLPLLIVVVDDGAWGAIAAHQRRRGGATSLTRLQNPDFAALAASYGVEACTARTGGAVFDAVGSALRRRGPSLLHLPVAGSTIARAPGKRPPLPLNWPTSQVPPISRSR